MIEKINESKDFISNLINNQKIESMIILGSGMGGFEENYESLYQIDYADIPNFLSPSIEGHAGKLSIVSINEKLTAILSGRAHYYEGHPIQDLVIPIRAFSLLGVQNLILTNAAGGISDIYEPGDIVSINDHINVVAVWTKNSSKVADSYIGQMWNYLQLNKHQIEFDRCLFIGDLNSNSIWDTMRTGGNHRTVVELLKSKDVHSIYHHKYNEEHGLESAHTFFMHRHLDKGFHIDYSFASSAIIKKLQNFQIGKKEEWLNDSDHLPMIVDLKD